MQEKEKTQFVGSPIEFNIFILVEIFKKPLEFNNFILVEIFKKPLSKLSKKIDFYYFYETITLQKSLDLCVNDFAKDEYLKEMHDKYFSLYFNKIKSLEALPFIIENLEDEYNKYVQNNLECKNEISLIDGFAQKAQMGKGFGLFDLYRMFLFKTKKIKQRNLSILTSYFLLKDVKRIITERLELKKIPENYNLDNLTIINPKGTEKIIMLKKLGVLDYLKEKTPFNTSTNSLASVISTITGIKQSSVYPMIQTIFNPLNNQKNNPLNSKKAVSSVKQVLNSLGYIYDK